MLDAEPRESDRRPPSGWEWDAFVSYRTRFAARARYLVDDLYRISKRHPDDPAPRMWIDRAVLTPVPSLDDELRRAVRGAHHLIVLLDRHTARSKIVALEIAEWFDGGGTPERLALIAVQSRLRLRIDDGRLGPAKLLRTRAQCR